MDMLEDSLPKGRRLSSSLAMRLGRKIYKCSICGLPKAGHECPGYWVGDKFGEWTHLSLPPSLASAVSSSVIVVPSATIDNTYSSELKPTPTLTPTPTPSSPLFTTLTFIGMNDVSHTRKRQKLSVRVLELEAKIALLQRNCDEHQKLINMVLMSIDPKTVASVLKKMDVHTPKPEKSIVIDSQNGESVSAPEPHMCPGISKSQPLSEGPSPLESQTKDKT